jgi:hypothetical protein
MRDVGISCHFQTDQQIDIAREAANRGFAVAGAPVGANRLRPLRFELLKRVSFVTKAPIDTG